MKVLLFTHIFPAPSLPTRGTFNFDSFKSLAHHAELRLISPEVWWSRITRPWEFVSPPRAEMSGISAVYPTFPSIPRFGPSLQAGGLYRTMRRRVARLRDEFPFEVILATWAYPDATAAARIASDLNCPLVIKVHGTDVNVLTRIDPIRDQIVDAFRIARFIISVSGAMKERIVELGIDANKVIVLRNAVEGARFRIRDKAEARKELGIPTDGSVVTFVGRLSHEKGVDVLLDAMPLVHGARLAIVGSGAHDSALRNRVSSAGLTDRIMFAGTRPHAEIPTWISACDVLALPSRREGCPNVVLEALASGRPVVASSVGGVPELLNPNNGIMVPPDDAPALAAGVNEALTREWHPEELRNSVGSLSWDDVGLRLWTVLNDAVRVHGSH